jgi:hypothetical protein
MTSTWCGDLVKLPADRKMVRRKFPLPRIARHYHTLQWSPDQNTAIATPLFRASTERSERFKYQNSIPKFFLSFIRFI